jgi:hypothetical protein
MTDVESYEEDCHRWGGQFAEFTSWIDVWRMPDDCWQRKPCPQQWLLIAVASCRLVWELLDDVERRRVIAAEEIIDDRKWDAPWPYHASRLAGLKIQSSERPTDALFGFCRRTLSSPNYHHLGDIAYVSFYVACAAIIKIVPSTMVPSTRRQMLSIIKDVIYSPSRAAPELWRCDWSANDRAVTRVAEEIYQGRRFELMPHLCDALQDAGCTDPEVLQHCYRREPHVRGCWLLEGLLVKG